MQNLNPNLPSHHERFLASSREHMLMLTTHGIHQWDILPGLPDTGGQNVFVNQFSDSLVKFGFRVTIANRGGYQHPVTGGWQRGLHYKDEHQRILYLEDGLDQFVRKEDMGERIPLLVKELIAFLQEDKRQIHGILSHYWDAALVGLGLNETMHHPVQHVWFPHSLGVIKKRNITPEQASNLRIAERIASEREILTQIDVSAATSPLIQRALKEDYGFHGEMAFLPPCVDPQRFHPRHVEPQDDVWTFLGRRSGLPIDAIRSARIVIEISRTDETKRKAVLLKAFAEALNHVNDALLVISIDDTRPELAAELYSMIQSLDLGEHIAVVGSVHSLLPTLYAISDVYCTPSVMEGFGMSIQEAAASGVACVASDLVPFASQYLLGPDPREIWHSGNQSRPLLLGKGAIVVPADDVAGFAYALQFLLTEEASRKTMAEEALRLTIPSFTWDARVPPFLRDIGMPI
jgi:glycosyltransferase involved in cell wall biosynthesis